MLILAPSGRDSAIADQLFSQVDIETYVCHSIPELFEHIEIGAGAVLLASEVFTGVVIADLSRILERQPAWSDLSIIIITGAGTGASRSSQLRELSSLTNATILERPVRAATITNSVKIALRARARQYVMRDHLVERTRLEMQLADAYHKQHRIAETLQRSMLNKPARNAFPGLNVASIYIAANDEAEVGGDFFDIFAADDQRVAIVVGDVSGKGLRAAARSLEIKHPLRAFLRVNPSPGAALEMMNSYLNEAQRLDHTDYSGFVCLCVCIYHTQSALVTWCTAGFEGPLIVGTGRQEMPECSNPPIGVVEEQLYFDEMTQIHKNDTVILFTDGVTEARSGSLFFGAEGVINTLRDKKYQSPDDIVKSVADRASAFADDEMGDDVCIVAFQRDDAAG